MGDFHDDILAPGEMALIHDAMIGRFCWFEHVGRFSRYRSYQTGRKVAPATIQEAGRY
jgi:hypothetical protein